MIEIQISLSTLLLQTGCAVFCVTSSKLIKAESCTENAAYYLAQEPLSGFMLMCLRIIASSFLEIFWGLFAGLTLSIFIDNPDSLFSSDGLFFAARLAKEPLEIALLVFLGELALLFLLLRMAVLCECAVRYITTHSKKQFA